MFIVTTYIVCRKGNGIIEKITRNHRLRGFATKEGMERFRKFLQRKKQKDYDYEIEILFEFKEG